MEFSLTEDQMMIADSAASYLRDQSDSEAIRAAMQLERGYSPESWQAITEELGWHLTTIPEEFDGLGLGYVEQSLILEQMGQHLFCAPFLSTAVLGANALRIAGTDEQQQEYLRKISNEGHRLAFAYAAAGRHWGVDAVTATYQIENDEVVLNGGYAHVVDGHTAETLIVVARPAGTTGNEGLALFIIPAESEGVRRSWQAGMDQTRKLASITLTDARFPTTAMMRDAGNAATLFQQLFALAAIALSAEQLGVAHKTLAMTVEYISERKQFGRAVGSFQAMKHKAADMMLRVEAARAAVYYAASVADEFIAGSPQGEELIEAANIAKAYCSEAAFENSAEALQMHGGVGFTWEYDVHLYLKRAKALQHMFGDSAWHKQQLATQLLGAVP